MIDLYDQDELLDEAGRRFLDDAAEILRQYFEATSKHGEKYTQAVEEADRIRREAEAEHDAAVRGLRAEYAPRIVEAARIRGKRAEHPDELLSVARVEADMLANGWTTDPKLAPGNVRCRLLNAARQRADREAMEERERASFKVPPPDPWHGVYARI